MAQTIAQTVQQQMTQTIETETSTKASAATPEVAQVGSQVSKFLQNNKSIDYNIDYF